MRTNRQPKSRHPPPKGHDSTPSSLSLEQLQREMGLLSEEVKRLSQALAAAKHEQKRTPEEHEEDEDWLKWAFDKAKTYGPQLIKLIETL